MIDIHNHALYAVDDGSTDMEMSLSLLRNAYEDGIRQLIITPHYMHGGRYRVQADEILERFSVLKEAVKNEGNPIELYIGNELMINKHLDELLENRKILSLAGTDYVLVEFPFTEYLEEYDEYLYNITTLGYKVIIAHPERYAYLQRNHSFVDRWLDEGYLLQANGSSLKKRESEKVIIDLISRGKLSFIASDGHQTEWRPILLKEAFLEIVNKFSLEIAEKLFEQNQKLLLNNQPIPLMPSSKRKGWFSF